MINTHRITPNFNKTDLEKLNKRYKTNLINSLSGYKSANLIGTTSTKGNNNLAIFSSVMHLGATPPLVGFINRPHTVERQTIENIYESGFYTINHVAHSFYEQAHHTSARYGPNDSEFSKAKLTPQHTDFFAPYVSESNVKFGVEFRQKIDIELNQTILVIGEIVEILCDPTYIKNDGKVDVNSAGSVAVSGLDEYHTGKILSRLPYAKPK